MMVDWTSARVGFEKMKLPADADHSSIAKMNRSPGSPYEHIVAHIWEAIFAADGTTNGDAGRSSNPPGRRATVESPGHQEADMSVDSSLHRSSSQPNHIEASGSCRSQSEDNQPQVTDDASDAQRSKSRPEDSKPMRPAGEHDQPETLSEWPGRGRGHPSPEARAAYDRKFLDAAYRQDSDTIHGLLQKGVAVDYKGPFGLTALRFAILGDHEDRGHCSRKRQ
jgi:hypothetical protein